MICSHIGIIISGEIYSRISTRTPTILMISMYFLCCTRVWMNAFGISTTATSMRSSASMIHVSSTDYVAKVGKITSSLAIKSLCLLPPDNVLPLMVPYLLSFRKIWYCSVCFLCSYDMFLQCSGRKVYLMCSCFILE